MEQIMAILGICYGASWWTTSVAFLCWPFSDTCGIDLLVLKAEDANARLLRVVHHQHLHHDHNSSTLKPSHHSLTGEALSNTLLISSHDISFDEFSSFRSINIIIITIDTTIIAFTRRWGIATDTRIAHRSGREGDLILYQEQAFLFLMFTVSSWTTFA
jgi:hypothetical protein